MIGFVRHERDWDELLSKVIAQCEFLKNNNNNNKININKNNSNKCSTTWTTQCKFYHK